MQCLRTILGVSSHDRIRNTDIRKRLGVKKTIIDIIRKRRLKWFGHLNRFPDSSYVKKVYRDDFKNKRPRGRPPKRWSDQIRFDTNLPLLTAERLAKDGTRWNQSPSEEPIKLDIHVPSGTLCITGPPLKLKQFCSSKLPQIQCKKQILYDLSTIKKPPETIVSPKPTNKTLNHTSTETMLSLSAPVFTPSSIPLFSANQTVTLPQTPISLSHQSATRSYHTALNQSNNITATQPSNNSLKHEIENIKKRHPSH